MTVEFFISRVQENQFTVTSGNITPTDFGQSLVEFNKPDGSEEAIRVDSVMVNGAAVEIQSGALELSGSELCLEEFETHAVATVTF